MMRNHGKVRLVAALVLFSVGCPGRNGDGDRCDPAAPDCAEGLVCDPVIGDEPRCVGRLLIRGLVLNIIDDQAIEGARVQAVDANGAAVGTTGRTDANGAYEITVPAFRDDDGAPAEGAYTLRVQAQGFQEFPTAIRPALPIDAATAVEEGDDWLLESSLTTVKLIALLGDTSVLGSISGTLSGEDRAGVLVVAEGAGGTFVGFSDADGAFTVFNVQAGSYNINGYFAGAQFDSANVSVAMGEAASGVELNELDRPLNSVSGNVQIVNAPGGSVTSVVLAVESTFVEAVARGVVPPGLRVGGVSGAFTIPGVPDGRYVVLAAFENDDLVRDPDENIGGTQIVHLEVPDPVTGNTISLSEGFKVTEALAVVSPGADLPEEVTDATPTFTWADDSSEEGYVVRVFDAFGTEVWNDEIPGVSGSATVSHAYAGPPLRTGLFYQFRVTSFRTPGGDRTSISTTEDLRGVFFYLGL